MREAIMVYNCGSGEVSPIVFYYFNLTGTDSFRTLLEERFRQTGHERPIVFKEWNCYKDLPERDGDLFAYDAVVLSTLVKKGFLAPLPEDVSSDGIFPWVVNRSRVRKRIYGLPFMLCSNALICRKQDDSGIQRVMELHENVAIPMRTMLMFYYIQAIFDNRSVSQSLKVLEHLLELIGGRDFLAESRLSDYDGINRFNRGDCRFFLGFTESLPYLKQDDYTVRFADFSAAAKKRKPLFMADLVSVGRQVRGDKRKDCLDLIKLMTEEAFLYDVCTLDGHLQYLLPADRRVFSKLAALDTVYESLYALVESEENGVLRYGERFYEDFYKHGDILLQFLWEKAGWKP